MTAEQNQRIKDAFESILDSPPTERTHLLGQLCADDAAVCAEVEASSRQARFMERGRSRERLRGASLTGLLRLVTVAAVASRQMKEASRFNVGGLKRLALPRNPRSNLMSKQKDNRKPSGKMQKSAPAPADAGRRKFILLGAGVLAAVSAGAAGYKLGWFGSGASYETALAAANEMLQQRAREIGNASVLIHAVRGFGKSFKLADGSSAVEHLCSRYAADREVNGKRYVYFKR
ncbi:MAG: hypothetical protein ABIU20_05645, partial [Blastocatellia bacterium]